MAAEMKPCFDCGTETRVSPFGTVGDPYAYHEEPIECIRALAERVAALEKARASQ